MIFDTGAQIHVFTNKDVLTLFDQFQNIGGIGKNRTRLQKARHPIFGDGFYSELYDETIISHPSLLKDKWEIEYNHNLKRYSITKDDQMYYFDLIDDKFRCISNAIRKDLLRIHCTLGHPGHNTMIQIKEQSPEIFEGISTSNIKDFTCEHCQRGKMTRIKKKHAPITSRIGELVHVDIFEINSTYFFISTDNYSKYIIAIAMKKKDGPSVKAALTETNLISHQHAPLSSRTK